LFSNISIPQLLPLLEKGTVLQKLWDNLLQYCHISFKNCDAAYIDKEVKDWVKLFTSIYQTKDVTPYIHCFCSYISVFVCNMVTFTQNDLTTFFSSISQTIMVRMQILEKQNHEPQ